MCPEHEWQGRGLTLLGKRLILDSLEDRDASLMAHLTTCLKDKQHAYAVCLAVVHPLSISGSSNFSISALS